jgi:hypothetical protein
MPMPIATWKPCPGMQNPVEHMMRDGCYSCAPWWEKIPTCPGCGAKLFKLGKTKCKKCGEWVMVHHKGMEVSA